MSSITLDAYLFFQGNCKEAMEFYQSIFGGEIYTQTYDEAMGDKITPETKGMIIHASLKGGDIALLASDSPTASPKAAKISLSLSGEGEEKMRSIFDKLSTDGQVPYPLEKAFWGGIFGTLVDKFGIEWMMNITSKS